MHVGIYIYSDFTKCAGFLNSSATVHFTMTLPVALVINRVATHSYIDTPHSVALVRHIDTTHFVALVIHTAITTHHILWHLLDTPTHHILWRYVETQWLHRATSNTIICGVN